MIRKFIIEIDDDLKPTCRVNWHEDDVEVDTGAYIISEQRYKIEDLMNNFFDTYGVFDEQSKEMFVAGRIIFQDGEWIGISSKEAAPRNAPVTVGIKIESFQNKEKMSDDRKKYCFETMNVNESRVYEVRKEAAYKACLRQRKTGMKFTIEDLNDGTCKIIRIA